MSALNMSTQELQKKTATVSKIPDEVRNILLAQDPALYPEKFDFDEVDDLDPTTNGDTIFSLRARDSPGHTHEMLKGVWMTHEAVVAASIGEETVWLGKDSLDTTDKNVFWCRIALHTQTPYIRLKTVAKVKDDRKPIAITIFPEHVKMEENGRAMVKMISEAAISRHLEKERNIPNGIYEAANQRKLYVLTVWLKKPRNPIPVTGMTAEELAEVRGSGLFKKSLVNVADEASKLRIFLQLPFGFPSDRSDPARSDGLLRTGWQHADIWARYLATLMALNEHAGGSAFFYRQENSDDLRTNVPRWLIREVEWTEKNGKVQPETVLPTKWNSFGKVDIVPDTKVLFQQLALGLDRQADHQMRELQKILKGPKNIHVEGFFRGCEVEGFYTLYIHVRNPELFRFNDVAELRFESKVEVRVRISGPNTIQVPQVYRGYVIKVPMKNSLFTCCVTGPPIANQVYNLELVHIDDTLPNERDKEVLKLMEHHLNLRIPGPDIMRAFFADQGLLLNMDVLKVSTKRKEDSNDELLAALEAATDDREDKNKKTLEDFTRILKTMELDESQWYAALGTTQSNSGINLIQGPAGTGKTRTGVAIALAHAAMDRKVMFSSTCSDSLLVAMKQVANWQSSKLGHILEESEFVFFDGGYSGSSAARQMSRKYPSSDANETVQDWNADFKMAEASIYRQIRDDQSEDVEYRHFFNAKLKAVSEKNQDKVGFPWSLAQEYRNNLAFLKKASIKDKEAIQQRNDKLEEEFAKYYLKNVVKIVFCNTAMACHPLLQDAFPTKVVIIDDSSSASAMDILSPVASSIETMQQLVVIGDHKQLKPLSKGPDRNEFHKQLSKGSFQELAENEFGLWKVDELKVCYRMAPKLAEFPSRAFYGNTLQFVSHGHDVALEATMDRWLRLRLANAWNELPRVAFDVSGDNIEHEPYLATGSLCNREEARRLIEDACDILASIAPHDGRPILASDIVILATFPGQVELIRAMIQQKLEQLPPLFQAPNHPFRDMNSIPILTVRESLGKEWPIVLCSFVTNTGKRTGRMDSLQIDCLAEDGILAVSLTRARAYNLLYGNFRKICAMSKTKHPGLVNQEQINNLVADFESQGTFVTVRDAEMWRTGMLPDSNSWNTSADRSKGHGSSSGRGRKRRRDPYYWKGG